MSFRHLLVVHEEHALAAGAWLRRIRYELVLDHVLAGGKCRGIGDVRSLQSKEVVFVMDLSVFHVERPATEPPSLRDNHAAGVAIVQFHWRSDRVMAVLYVDEGVFHHANHPGIYGQRSAGAHKIRSSC